MSIVALDILLAFALALALVWLLVPVAIRLRLEDRPDERKTHHGHIPLIGGIVIYLTLVLCMLLIPRLQLDRQTASFLVAGGVLVIAGAVDDRSGLDVRLRILVEAAAASILIFGGQVWIGNLGNLFGLGEIHMPFWIAYPFTLVAVFGILNAFNMIDGMDGLAGGISLAVIAILLLVTDISPGLDTLGPLLVGALLAYLICNLKLLPWLPKIFLGDAGSKLIGLALVWFLIASARSGSQGQGGIAPATALFLVGLPLFDMVATTIRRGRRGVSPFAPDRTHIHHLLLAAGYSRSTVMGMVLGCALALNLTGVALSLTEVAEVRQFAAFFALYLLYSQLTGKVLDRIDRARQHPVTVGRS